MLQRKPDHDDRLNANPRLTKRDALAIRATDYFTPHPSCTGVARGLHDRGVPVFLLQLYCLRG